MEKEEIRKRCQDKSRELLEKYFGNLIQETVSDKPELLDGQYTKDLPLKIEKEFYSFLEELNAELHPEDKRPLKEILDSPEERYKIQEDYESDVNQAYEDATTVTFWERIKHDNHKDVAFFKGLIKQYTEELLEHMTNDFLDSGNTV